MYLLNLDNQAYFYITLVFALIFGVAYYCRKISDKPDLYNISAIGACGILELIIYAFIGAKFGINGILYVVLAHILAIFLELVASYTNLHSNKNKIFLLCYSIIAGLTSLIMLIASIGLFAKLSYAIVGYRFANGALAISIFAMICALVGGKRGVIYNIRWIFFFIVIVVLLAIFIALDQNGLKLINNLNELSINQAHIANYYSGFAFNMKSMFVIIIVGIFLFVTRICDDNLLIFPKKIIIIRSLLAICIAIIFTCVGVISIATPNSLSNQGNSITYQAQLSNGQTAYVVKSIENKNGININTNPGLIPPILDEKTSLAKTGQYEYTLAMNSMLQHYLPKPCGVFAFIILMLAFIVSLSTYALLFTNIAKNQIIKYFPTCDALDLSKSWTWRVIFVVVCLVSLIISAVFLQYI